MKKFLVIMLSLVMALTMFTACGQKEETTSQDVSKIGILTNLDSSEKELSDERGSEYFFFDDLNSMLLALESGKIDKAVGLPSSVTKYIEKINDKFINENPRFQSESFMTMGTLKDNIETYNLLNDAINTLKDNGTIDQLTNEYIDKLVESGEEPPTVEIPSYEGAKTIKVAITGDRPPIDFVATDGTPAGFNVALLAEIAKLANVNIELVQVNSGSRLMALTEGSVDAVFCFKKLKSEDGKLNSDTTSDIPESVSVTTEYYECQNGTLVKK